MKYATSVMSIVKAFNQVFALQIIFILLIGCSNQPFEDELNDNDASGRYRKNEITGLILVDAITNLDIAELTTGYSFTTSAANVRAESDGASVVFTLSGAETHRQVENTVPFALKGDNSGKYTQWVPKAGDYSLTITPYAGADGTGREGRSKIVTFKVKEKIEVPIPPDPTPTPIGEILFSMSWKNLTISPRSNGYTINGLTTPSFIDNIAINNIGSSAHIRHEIIDYSGEKVLKAYLIDDDPNVSGTSRAQMSVRLKDDLKVIHTRHRMWIHPDIKFLETHPDKITWFTVYELWNERDDAMTGNVAGSARWNLSLRKDTGAGNSFYWDFDGEWQQPEELMFKDIIPDMFNKNIPVPFGKWFTIEMYLLRDNTNGRFIWSIQEDGGTKKILFDYSGCTIYPGREDLQMHSVQAYKFYTDDKYMDFMRNNGKEFSVMSSDYNMLK